MNLNRIKPLNCDNYIWAIGRITRTNNPILNFKSDKGTMKISLFYFIEHAMIGRERRQHMDWTMLGLIDDLKDFISYN